MNANRSKDSNLGGYDKAAILLMMLGEDLAAEVMKNLDPKDIRKLGGMISSSSGVPEKDMAAVLSEFTQNAEGELGLSLEGKSYIHSVLNKALGQEKAMQIMDTLRSPEQSGLEALKWLEPKTISGMIGNEHPQTIALILTHLSADQGAQILAHLPEELRNAATLRMATLEEIPNGVMKEISEVLQAQISNIGTTSGQKVGGLKHVAKILNVMDQSIEQNIMGALSENHTELADQIRQLMFVFEDLVQIDDRSMQDLLKDLTKEQLTLALKASKEEVKEKFFKNMSERASQMLKDDIEAMGPVKLSDVENNQQAILKKVQKLVEEGRINIGGKGKDVLV